MQEIKTDTQADAQAEKPGTVESERPTRRRSRLATIFLRSALVILLGAIAFVVVQFVVTKRSVLPLPIDTPTWGKITALIPASKKNVESGNPKEIPSPTPTPQIARLAVQSDPPGLQTEIVDEAQRTLTSDTPITLEHEPTGKYIIRIKRDGWPEYKQEINLHPNASVTVGHSFQDAKVTLRSDPPGAIIFMGDTELGETPLTVSLPPKPVELISHSGELTPVIQQVVPDLDNPRTVEFKHNYGILSVNSGHLDADIIIGAVDRGHPPVVVVVSPGPQEVTVRVPGMPEQTQTANIENGQRVELQFNFAVSTPTPEPSATPDSKASPQPTVSPTPMHHHEIRHRHARTAIARSKNDAKSTSTNDSCPTDAPGDSKK